MYALKSANGALFLATSDPPFTPSKIPATLPIAFLMLEKTKSMTETGCLAASTGLLEDRDTNNIISD